MGRERVHTKRGGRKSEGGEVGGRGRRVWRRKEIKFNCNNFKKKKKTIISLKPQT